jgi:hypothetical protein
LKARDSPEDKCTCSHGPGTEVLLPVSVAVPPPASVSGELEAGVLRPCQRSLPALTFNALPAQGSPEDKSHLGNVRWDAIPTVLGQNCGREQALWLTCGSLTLSFLL